MSMYHISETIGAMIAASEAAMEAGDEAAAAAFEEHVQALMPVLQERAGDFFRAILEFEANASAKEAEAKRLRESAGRDKRTAEALRKRIKEAMQRTGTNRLPTPIGDFRVQRNGGAQPLDIPDDAGDYLPDHLVRIERVPDKARIRAALEAGEQVDGCVLQDRGWSLIMR